MKNQYLVECPECDHQFSVEEAVTGQLKSQLEKEYNEKTQAKLDQYEKKSKALKEREAQLDQEKQDFETKVKEAVDGERQNLEVKIKKKVTDEMEVRLNSLKEENEDLNDKINNANKREVELLKKERDLNNKESEMELRFQRKLNETIEKSKEKWEADLGIKLHEKEEKIDQLKRKIEDLKKGAEQGSMQIQGEAGEKAIEELLTKVFTDDEISEVPKGFSGADCTMTVFNHNRNVCGKVIIESKRTKSFSNGWITKLKEDMVQLGADEPVIVTEAMPDDIKGGMGLKDGVWVCSFDQVVNVMSLLRHSILQRYEVRIQEEGKGGKAQELYKYMTGQSFKQRMVQSFELMKDQQEQLQKEQRVFQKNWKVRQKQISKMANNFIDIYGNYASIAGGENSFIKELELDQLMIEK